MSREQFIQNTKPLVAEPPSPTWGEAMNCGAFPTFEQNQGGGHSHSTQSGLESICFHCFLQKKPPTPSTVLPLGSKAINQSITLKKTPKHQKTLHPKNTPRLVEQKKDTQNLKTILTKKLPEKNPLLQAKQ